MSYDDNVYWCYNCGAWHPCDMICEYDRQTKEEIYTDYDYEIKEYEVDKD